MFLSDWLQGSFVTQESYVWNMTKNKLGISWGFSDILERGESNSTEEKLIHLLHLDRQINEYENDYRSNFFNCLGINLIPSLLKFA